MMAGPAFTEKQGWTLGALSQYWKRRIVWCLVRVFPSAG